MLETCECVTINNKDRVYTDCMEFSLLRFMQILLYDDKSSRYNPTILDIPMKDILRDYINKYNKIHIKTDYYNTTNGIKERSDWATLVSDHNTIFDYYRNDQSELFTNVKNVLLFFNYFFEIPIDFEKPDDYNLDNIISSYRRSKLL